MYERKRLPAKGGAVQLGGEQFHPTQNTGDTQPDSPRYHRGQRYDLLAVEPHTRKDGKGTLLAVWRSNCAQCGEAFTFRSPLLRKRFEPNRRCATHKRPGCVV